MIWRRQKIYSRERDWPGGLTQLRLLGGIIKPREHVLLAQLRDDCADVGMQVQLAGFDALQGGDRREELGAGGEEMHGIWL